MTGASEDFLQAVYGLRKAAEAEFQGNTYYKVANEIDGLIETLGWDAGMPAGKDAAYGFASMLAEARKLARANLFANDYYRIANKLEHLSSFLSPSAPAAGSEAKSEESAASAALNGHPNPPLYVFGGQRPSFDDLAAKSKARAGGVIKSFGIGPAPHAVAPEAPHREPEPIIAGELERRSSEPCAMAELAPVILEPVAAAAVFAETPAVPSSGHSTYDLGSSSFEAGDGAIEGAAVEAPAEEPAYTAAEVSASEYDRAAGAARQEIESFDAPAVASEAQIQDAAVHQEIESFEAPAVASEAQIQDAVVHQEIERFEAPAVASEAQIQDAVVHQEVESFEAPAIAFEAQIQDAVVHQEVESFEAPAVASEAQIQDAAVHQEIESFDALAVASEAQIQDVAACQEVEGFDAPSVASEAQIQDAAGLDMAGAQETPPAEVAAVEEPTEWRLESRSSEELAPAVEVLEPASVSREAAAPADTWQAPLHLGSPAAQSEAYEAAGLREIAAEETAAEAPAAPVSAPEKVEAKKVEEPKRPRTFFGRLFGRGR